MIVRRAVLEMVSATVFGAYRIRLCAARDSGLGAGIAEEVAGEGEEAGEFIGGIDVAFEDIKREVVEAAERPHGEKEQGGDAKGWPLEKQQDRREHTQE